MIDKMLIFLVPGLIYGIGAIGLALILRYLRFPDFSVLGSIMLGGIVCIYVTKLTNSLLGTLAGFLTGGALGLVTGILIHHLEIPRVLAGIITFTASNSFGYFIAKVGTIDLPQDLEAYLHPSSNFNDVLIVLAIALFICLFISFLIKTKLGSLILAMTSNENFLNSRHRYQGIVIVVTLILGNAIVGLAGSLFVLKLRSAQIISHMDFLPFSLASIFGGNAVAYWIYRILNKGEDENTTVEKQQTNFKRLLKTLLNLVSIEREDSSMIGFLFFLYVLGCLFLSEISGLVNANAFKSIHPYLNIPANSQYLVVAVLIVIFTWLAGWKEKK